MKLMWLGQAGYRIVTDNGTVILIDPYMSDSLHESRGESYVRTVPINSGILHAPADVLILTHGHADHKDFGTLDVLLAGKPVNILTPLNTFLDVRSRYGGDHNYVMFDHGIEVTIHGIRFSSVYAAHSDERAIGVDIYADGKIISHAGDSMYHRCLKNEHPQGADALLLPINGWGCNMNAADAARLTRELRPKRVFPMHWDMFTAYGSDVNEFTKLFGEDSGISIEIPEYYREMDI